MTTLVQIENAVRHEDGCPDCRYSVTQEFTGHECRWYVARFKGHWIGEATTEERAWELARNAAKGRG